MNIILVLLVVSWSLGSHAQDDLDEYVARPESVYSYTRLSIHYPTDGKCELHVLNMTSLKWMDESFVNHSIWWHYLTIAIPTNIRNPEAAFFHVGSGNNPDDAPTLDNDGYLSTLCDISDRIGAVGGYIKMIPNQPLFFGDAPLIFNDTEPLKVEDRIIGYTWKVFIEEQRTEPEVIALFPMVKAAKLGVDTMITYANSVNSAININKYMPSGSSKRGWVTWLLAVVDSSRVFAMVPRVFDLLNFYENLHHHHMAYGGWSWAFTAYYLEDVPKYLNHPRTEIIGDYIDPFEYNDRLTMPKLLIVSSSDEFFLPDGSHYFWSGLTEPKYMSLLENADHGQGGKGQRINDNIVAFFLAAQDPTYVWPSFTWQRSQILDANDMIIAGMTTVLANPEPNMIHAWWADTTNMTFNRRDFRQTINILTLDQPEGEGTQFPLPGPNTGIEWFKTNVDGGGGSYSLTLPRRTEEDQFKGFFIQAHYDSLEPDKELILTTEINVIPDVLPFQRCVTEDECTGLLK